MQKAEFSLVPQSAGLAELIVKAQKSRRGFSSGINAPGDGIILERRRVLDPAA